MKRTKPNHALTALMFAIFLALLLLDARKGPDVFLGIPAEQHDEL